MTESRENIERLESLARRAVTGDAEVVDRLLGTARPLVYRWALVRTGGTDDAEDVTQTVLLKLRDAVPELRNPSALRSWLYRTTMNASIDHLRSVSKRNEVVDDLRLPLNTAADAVGAGSLTRQRLVELVRTFFQELPDRQRQVFDLVDLQRVAAGEAAEILDLSPSTVRVHLLRARRAIRTKILEGHPMLVDDWRGSEEEYDETGDRA